MYGKQEQVMMWMDANSADPEIPAWKSLDIVTRQWASLSGFEKDQEKYAKLREISMGQRPKYQD